MWRFWLLCGAVLSLNVSAGEGMIWRESQHSVTQTLDKLSTVLESKGMTIFARINHSEGAKSVGKQLADTQLLIFGNPNIGTPLMQCQQTIAIDLPQKVLVWQDVQGKVWLSYNDPLYLAKRHDIDMDSPCYPILEKISGVLANFAKVASE
ncbi:DUF302 domain-containing protein [Planctobacterium marinum]|uniref:DUF302 domain-containing protein n=1 Tax=Planctobacterium marinum TaxID=1631968 RepID=UPI001E57590B|nr:DUF302 domain-containing protein [Planctobacterium marinum]MCC2605248.1 DUF302 domain-containing protein [Planctobacterium marinum]